MSVTPVPTVFESILVANRGEIACRILVTAHRLGYRTIAVYSEADRDMPHVRMADEAVCIGPAPAAESYLSVERVLAAARDSGASALHPGYGFLAENADFARACESAGLVFIGPPVPAIALMGNKAAAKRHMMDAGVACLPGYHGKDGSDAALIDAAAELGFPVMVKAAAGGGGRGMRRVDTPEQLPAALARARAEAAAAFGSDELILERAVVRPRHVEVQIVADAHGNTIHLGERDCSVQRRHQKVIEEAPCPVLSPQRRARIGAAAVAAAVSIGYRGAGTVEFLLDQAGDFHFMEMNTRLQVEHPVTEMITGIDLVELQIRVAQGEALGLTQSDVAINGHAIEARLYAEDPATGFLPATGHIDRFEWPSGPGVRVDAGVATGCEISPYYDPMVAKIIAWGASREVALRRLRGALAETALFGPVNNRDFLLDALSRPGFADGTATTAFVADEYADGFSGAAGHLESTATAAVLQHLDRADRALSASVCVSPRLRDWSSTGVLVSHFIYAGPAGPTHVTATTRGEGGYRVDVAGEPIDIEAVERAGKRATLAVNGQIRRVTYHVVDRYCIHLADGRYSGTWTDTLGATAASDERDASGRLLAPMHGVLVDLAVRSGDRVAAGDPLAVLEAMKMQHALTACVDGTVGNVYVAVGAQIAAGALILDIDTPPGD